jgi:tetratricopeptide (TPR) repeat protein
MGQYEEAEATYGSSIVLLDGLAKNYPDEVNYHHELAVSHNNLGNLLQADERSEEAEAEYLRALSIRWPLVQSHPESQLFQHGLTKLYINLGVCYHASKQLEKAETSLTEALRQVTELVKFRPDDLECQLDRARCYSNRGLVRRDQNAPAQVDKAKEDFQNAIALLRTVRQAHPESATCQQLLARTLNNLSGLLLLLHSWQQAGAACGEALTLQGKLVQDYPDIPLYNIELGSIHLNLGNALAGTDRPDEAIRAYSEAIRLFGAVPQERESKPKLRQYLCKAHAARAEALATQNLHAKALVDWTKALEFDDGNLKSFLRSQRAVALVHSQQHPTAVQEAEALLGDRTLTPDIVYDLARVFAQASLVDDSQPQAYARRALETLRRAIQMGYSDRESLRTEPDFLSLRAHAEFQQLLDQSLEQ